MDIKTTIEKFGYSPESLSLGSPKPIIYTCLGCNKNFQCERRKYKNGKKCVHCTNSGNKFTKEELTKEIHQIIKQLGYQPSEDEFIKISKRSATTLKKVFQKATWKEILASLGYKVLRRKNDPRSYEEIAQDVRQVKDKLKKLPTASEYRNNGKFTLTTIYRVTKLSKWTDLVKKVFNIDPTTAEGFTYNQRRTREFYYEKLRKLALKVGHTPTTKEANDAGINVAGLKKKLGMDWPSIIKSAGLDKVFFIGKAKTKSITNEEILNDIKRVARLLDKVPTEKEYEEHGVLYFPTYKRRFGGKWIKILESAGLSSPENPNKSKSASLLATDEEVLNDIRRVGIILNKIPTIEEYLKHGGYGRHTILRRFDGKWKKAIELAQVEDFLNSENSHEGELPVIEMGKVEDSVADFLRTASVKSIAAFFQKK